MQFCTFIVRRKLHIVRYLFILQSNIVFGDPSVNPRNHTSSLDFDRDDEILHYPFFVRRARSLDQDMDTRCRVQNRFVDDIFI